MLLFLIFAVLCILIGLIVLTIVGVIGTGFLLVFGDLIIFILIMLWILKRLFRKKRK